MMSDAIFAQVRVDVLFSDLFNILIEHKVSGTWYWGEDGS